MTSKGRPQKMKTSIAKLRGVERDRAVLASTLVSDRDYAVEAADLVALAVFPFEDDLNASAPFRKEIGSVAMDIAAVAETSAQGAAVNAAAMAFHAYRGIAEEHRETAYLTRFDQTIVGLARLEERFGD